MQSVIEATIDGMGRVIRGPLVGFSLDISETGVKGSRERRSHRSRSPVPYQRRFRDFR
jgi:hypothetical protein